ncbi:MAG: hypothetical protein AUG51_11710, partial [Acidobacteria bacterium 13_1_20CM_3_53_8]
MASSTKSAGYTNASFGVSSLAAGTYHARVTAVASGYNSSVSNSRDNNISIEKLATVSALQFAYNSSSEKIDLSWPSVKGASSYQVQYFKNGSHMTGSDQTISASPAHLDTSGLAAGDYTARVLAVADSHHVNGEWSAASNQVTKLAAPAFQSLSYASGNVQVNLASVTGASRYKARLVDSSNHRTDAVESSNPTIEISADELASGTYHAEAMATGSDNTKVPSDWRTSSAMVTKLAAPAVSAAVWDESAAQVVVTLAAVSGAASLSAQLVAADQTPVGSPVAAGSDLNARIRIDNNLTAGSYGIRTQAASSGSQFIPSDWSVSSAAVLRLAQPAITSFTYDEVHETIVVSFQSVANATAYEVQLLNSAGHAAGAVVSVQAGAAGTTAYTAQLSVAGLPVDTYKAQVRAVSTDQQTISSVWAVSAQSLTELAAPAIGSVAYDASRNQVKVVIAAGIPGAAGYQIQYLNAQGIPLGQAVFVNPASLTGYLPGDYLQPVNYFVRAR